MLRWLNFNDIIYYCLSIKCQHSSSFRNGLIRIPFNNTVFNFAIIVYEHTANNI